ncbi:MAG: hypothetical protein MI755_06500 [Sphingomonadales bacterium]|nr:hypothetical protein [Sphingomonadales bacterium]
MSSFRHFRQSTTVIPDGDNQARTSQVDRETFVLGRGDSTTVDGAPVVTFDNDRVTFDNRGAASTTGDTATVSIDGDRGQVKNARNAEISADQTAIEVAGEDARINNDGTIDGGFNGVNFVNGGVSSGLLRNTGTISSDSRAVNIGGEGILVANHGRIVGTGDQRNGTIYSDATADEYAIINGRRGVIDAGLDNDGAGIALQLGEEVDAGILNSGTIRGRGQAPNQTPEGTPNGLAGDGIRLFSGVDGSSTFDGNIVNNGRILSDSEQGPVAALRVANGVNFDGAIVNGRRGEISGANNGLYFGTGEHDARVKNFGLISSDSRAVNIDGSGVELNNFGRILGTGDQRNGTVYADGTANDYAINNGRRGVIDAGEGNDGAGIALQLGTAVDADIANFGTVQGRGQAPNLTPEGTPNGLAGDGIRLFSGVDGSSTFDGNIFNNGRLLSESEQGPIAGLRVANGVNFDGTIFNGRRGEISGANNGLYFGTGEHDARVKNFGLISSDSRAVNIDGSGVQLSNFGRILGTGDQRNGTIYADGTAEDYAIFNGRRGVIDAGEGNEGSGVSLQTGEVDGDIVEAELVNFGRISGRGQGEGNQIGHGVRVFSGVTDGTTTFLGDITNHGRITSDGAGGGADGGEGILVDTLIRFEGNILNSGTIDSADDGIEVNAESVFVGDIVNRGRIESEDDAIFLDDGVSFTGNITNDHIIDAADEGIELDPNVVFTGDITNNGRIDAEDDGIIFEDSVTFTGDLVNNGSIRADLTGIAILNIDAFNDGSIINRGTITGDADGDGNGVAIDASAAQVDLTVLNTGSLNGDVLLGDGNDRFDGTDGRVDGEIFGDGGQDTILGGTTADRIDGGSGDDMLTGGAGTDTFVFAQGTGSDTVTDFSFADERLDVGAFFADQASALAAARQDGDDTVIDLDVATGDQVRLLGVNVAELEADNFVV